MKKKGILSRIREKTGEPVGITRVTKTIVELSFGDVIIGEGEVDPKGRRDRVISLVYSLDSKTSRYLYEDKYDRRFNRFAAKDHTFIVEVDTARGR